MSNRRAGRPQKLSNWILLNALADGRKAMKSVRQIARELHVHPDTIYSSAKRFGIDIPLVLRGIPPEGWQTAPSNGESTQSAEPVEVAKPEKPETVSVNSCPVILGNGQPCPKPMPHRHAIGPNNHGFAPPQRPQFNIAMSYGPRRKPWER